MRLVKSSYEVWDRSGDPLALIERAGRVCYQSEPAGDSEGFVKRLIDRKHFSVLEHAWFATQGYSPFPIPSFMEWHGDKEMILGNARAWRNAIRRGKVGLPSGMRERFPCLFGDLQQKPDPLCKLVNFPDGLVFTVNFIIDRGVSHELVRHRPPSFSQESTRYCSYSGGVTFVIPPWVEADPGKYRSFSSGHEISDGWWNAMLGAEATYLDLVKYWSPQQARSVLPNSLKTQIVVTAYWTEWQIIFALRCASGAHPQMREVMVPLQQELASRYPEKFSDDVIQQVRGDLG